MKNKEDLRVIKTKENICRAFMELRETKTVNEIKLKEICERAKCSRNTFYDHFMYKESVLEYLNNRCMESIIGSLDFSREQILREGYLNVAEMRLSKMVFASLSTRELLHFLISYDRNNFTRNLTNALYEMFLNHPTSSNVAEKDRTEFDFYLRYLSSGLSAFIIYIIDHPGIDAEEARKMLVSIHSEPLAVAYRLMQ